MDKGIEWYPLGHGDFPGGFKALRVGEASPGEQAKECQSKEADEGGDTALEALRQAHDDKLYLDVPAQDLGIGNGERGYYHAQKTYKLNATGDGVLEELVTDYINHGEA